VTSTIYPDSRDTNSSGTDQVKTYHDRLGRVIEVADQRGSGMASDYEFDDAGRLAAQRNDTPPGGGSYDGFDDGGVSRIDRTYDDLGRVWKVTSSDGGVANEVKFTYDGWGNVVIEEQAHDGAVTGGTPAVQYTSDDGLPNNSTNTAALYLRLSKVTYPGGRTVGYDGRTTASQATATTVICTRTTAPGTSRRGRTTRRDRSATSTTPTPMTGSTGS
jgi:YD repeat-containing protein